MPDVIYYEFFKFFEGVFVGKGCLLFGTGRQSQIDVLQLERAENVARRSVTVLRREKLHHQLFVAIE